MAKKSAKRNTPRGAARTACVLAAAALALAPAAASAANVALNFEVVDSTLAAESGASGFEGRRPASQAEIPRFELNAPAPAPVGANRLTLTRLSAIISSVGFVRPDGSVEQMEGQYGAIDFAGGRRGFVLRNVPPGRYAGLQFLVGLRPAVNHADIGQWPAGHPLNPLVNTLHWGWQGGYVFMALEGRYVRPDGALGGWSMHLATDARLMLVQVPHSLEIRGDATVALALDLARLLAGITLAPTGGADSTHSAPGDALAATLCQNATRSFAVISFSGGTSDAPAAISSLSKGALDTPGKSAAAAAAATATPAAFPVPRGWPQPALPADNPLTREGEALGSLLFFDRRLSASGTQSCASCHAPDRAFSDRVAVSPGATGARGTRNAMPLFNLAWAPAYAWDGGKARIRDQALAALANPVEMNTGLAGAVFRLAALPEYRRSFEAAFGSPGVTPARIGLALEQYVLTLVSDDSKFDRAVAGEVELTEEEKEGFALFMTEFDPARGRRGADCFHCHGGPLFTDYGYKNNGLDLRGPDSGRAGVTGAPSDVGKFKTPSLRNVALTAPYMHDGRFATLEDVVAHYDHGVVRSATLDPNLAKHPDSGLGLSGADQHALVAFLRTLTGSVRSEGAP